MTANDSTTAAVQCAGPAGGSLGVDEPIPMQPLFPTDDPTPQQPTPATATTAEVMGREQTETPTAIDTSPEPSSTDPAGELKPSSPQEYVDGLWEVEPVYYYSQSSGSSANSNSITAATTDPVLSSSTGLSSTSLSSSTTTTQPGSSSTNSANSNTGAAQPSVQEGAGGPRSKGSRRGLIYKSVAEGDCEYKCFQDHQGNESASN